MSRTSVNALALLAGFLLACFAGVASADNYICVDVDSFNVCTQWAVDSSVRLPPLSIDDSVSLITKSFALWATCWVWVKLESVT